MWEVSQPEPVKLIFGILAADEEGLEAGRHQITEHFGESDLESQVWPFTQTSYYKDELGENVLRQFISISELIDPGELAEIKHTSNRIEMELAENIGGKLPRPVNIDPGIIEPSKLVLASTKNFSHRIYIGDRMYAELTLSYCRGTWQSFSYTFPDYKEDRYHGFFSEVRDKLVEQIRNNS